MISVRGDSGVVCTIISGGVAGAGVLDVKGRSAGSVPLGGSQTMVDIVHSS